MDLDVSKLSVSCCKEGRRSGFLECTVYSKKKNVKPLIANLTPKTYEHRSYDIGPMFIHLPS